MSETAETTGFKGPPPFTEGEEIKNEDVLKTATQQAGQDLSESASKQVAPKEESVLSKLCPRCGWDQVHTEVARPTDDDKQCFMRSILGLKRYEKQYSLVDNTLKVTFCALSVEEVDLILDQLREDGLPGPIAQTDPAIASKGAMSATELVVMHNRYRLVCSLKQLNTGTENIDFEPVFSGTVTPDDRVILPNRLKDLMKRLGSEPLFMMLLNQSQLFHREVDILVQRADDPDFWLTTAGPRSQ